MGREEEIHDVRGKSPQACSVVWITIRGFLCSPQELLKDTAHILMCHGERERMEVIQEVIETLEIHSVAHAHELS